MHLRHDGRHVLQVVLRQHGCLQVIGIAPVHAVLVGCVADDFPFLHRGHMAGVDAQGHAVLLPKMGKDRLLISRRGVFPQRPHTAECVAADEVVCFKPDDGGCDHVQEFLDMHILLCLYRDIFCSFQIGTSNPVRRESLPSALPTWFSGIKNTGHIPASGALPYHHSFFCLCFYYKAGDCPIPFCSCPSLGNGISNSRRISFWDSNSLSAINSIKPLSSLCACSSRDT